MSITLESIDITGLVISDEFMTSISGVTQVANDGSLIVYEQEIKFNDIILIGGSDWGWLDRATMASLHSMANVLDATYELDYEGTSHTVRFKSEDIPVISGDQLIKRSNVTSTDYYSNVIIKLMEV